MTTVNLRHPAAGGKLKAAGIAREQTDAVERVILEAPNQLFTKAESGDRPVPDPHRCGWTIMDVRPQEKQ